VPFRMPSRMTPSHNPFKGMTPVDNQKYSRPDFARTNTAPNPMAASWRGDGHITGPRPVPLLLPLSGILGSALFTKSICPELGFNRVDRAPLVSFSSVTRIGRLFLSQPKSPEDKWAVRQCGVLRECEVC
jgi:hypothetical protein